MLGQNTDYSLEKICFAPLSSEFAGPVKPSDCVIQSIWGYLSNDESKLDEESEDSKGFKSIEYLDTFIKCFGNSFNPDCLAPYGGPVDPAVALGGFLNGERTLGSVTDYQKADVVILTFLVNNYHNRSLLVPAKTWESAYVDFMKNRSANYSRLYANHSTNIKDLAFSSERSIEDELERESQSDVSTILISYLIMFVYIALSLGHIDFERYHRIMIDSKITLGVGGVVIVLASVVSSVGMFGFIGISATLIIVEVCIALFYISVSAMVALLFIGYLIIFRSFRFWCLPSVLIIFSFWCKHINVMPDDRMNRMPIMWVEFWEKSVHPCC